MNYQTLYYFKAAAEIQNLTKAASKLYISQPALSKAIHSLEKEVGIDLFEKQGRNIILTDAGKEFYIYINRAVDEINFGMQRMSIRAQKENNTITISAVDSMYASFLPKQVIDFKKNYPNSLFSLQYKGTSMVLEDVLNENAELGICSNFQDSPYNSFLERSLLKEEELIIIVPLNHKLADRKSIYMKELKDEKFLVLKKSKFGWNKPFLETCHKAGFEPNIIAEGYTPTNLIGMVSVGQGIAIISNDINMSLMNVVSLKILDKPAPKRNIYCTWKNNIKLSDGANRFKNFLISNAEKAE